MWMARRRRSSQINSRKTSATSECRELTIRPVRLGPACFLYQTRRLPKLCLVLDIILEATYDRDPLSGLKVPALEGNVLNWDKILIMGPSGSIPLSANSPFRLAEGFVTKHVIGVVKSIQDEGAIEALSVIVCSVDLLAYHASVQSDEN